MIMLESSLKCLKRMSLWRMVLGVDVLVDPYTGSSTGATRITVFKDVDVAVRHAESFSATQDYLTT